MKNCIDSFYILILLVRIFFVELLEKIVISPKSGRTAFPGLKRLNCKCLLTYLKTVGVVIIESLK